MLLVLPLIDYPDYIGVFVLCGFLGQRFLNNSLCEVLENLSPNDQLSFLIFDNISREINFSKLEFLKSTDDSELMSKKSVWLTPRPRNRSSYIEYFMLGPNATFWKIKLFSRFRYCPVVK